MRMLVRMRLSLHVHTCECFQQEVADHTPRAPAAASLHERGPTWLRDACAGTSTDRCGAIPGLHVKPPCSRRSAPASAATGPPTLGDATLTIRAASSDATDSPQIRGKKYDVPMSAPVVPILID